MCPGRFFVAWEIMALAVLLVLRFDIVPLREDGREGKWEVPRQRQESLATNIFPPERDVRVRVMERTGWEGCEWEFRMK